jgi:hypothetical protein
MTIDKTTGYVLVNQTDDSSALSTGSFQVSGGSSIGKSLWVGSDANVGGNLAVSGDVTVTGSITTNGNSSVSFSNTTDSTSTSTGSVVVLGGIGIAKSMYLGGQGMFVNTTASTSVTTGAVVISGGIGISAGAFVGGMLTVTNTTDSSSVTTGSVVTYGGLGVGKNFTVGGITKSVNTTDSTSITSGSLVTPGGVGITKSVNIGGSVSIGTDLSVTGTIAFGNTTDAVSPDTGSLIVTGGVGIGSSLFVGSTNDSSSSATGGVVVTGGFGVGKNSFFGGDVTLSGTNPLLTFANSGLSVPTFTTESAGTRLLLKTALSDTSVDYSIGLATNVMWSSVPQNTSTFAFKWYGGTTAVAQLNGIGNYSLFGTADTSSASTGALTVAGGAGFAKGVSVGTSLSVQSGSWTSTTGSDVWINASSASIHLTNNSTNSGEFESNLTDFNFRTVTLTPYVTLNVNKSSGHVSVFNTDDSTANHTGSFEVYGGASVSKSLWVGGNTTISGDLTVTGSMSGTNPVTFANTTDSTSVSTGGVVMNGGLGVSKNVYIGGLTVSVNTTVSVSSSTGALTVAGGIGIGDDSFFGGTTDSTSPMTGAVVVTGGVGIGSSLFVGSTNVSTSSTTGGVVVIGGVGVGGNSFFGGDVTFSNSGVGAPTFTTESNGTRVVLSSALSATKVDYAFGIDTNSLWTSVPQNNGTYAFNWYGGTTSAMTLDGAGNLTLSGTTDTASGTTGAFVVAGGVGVGGSLSVQSGSWRSTTGNDVYLNAESDSVFIRNAVGDDSGEFESNLTNFNFRTATSTPYVGFNINKTTGIVSVLTTTDATANQTGSFQVAGGASVSKSLWVGGNLTVNGSIAGTNPVTFSNTTNSTSTTTGSIIISGGIGIAKNAYIGGLTVSVNTTASSSPSTGAVTVAGGIGVGADSYFGGRLFVSNTTDSVSTTTGSIITSGGVGIAKNAYVGGLISSSNTTSSSSPSTGALTVAGGIGVGADSYFGGRLFVSNTTNSVSTTTGALTVAGGVGVGGAAFLGGDLTFSGAGLAPPTFTTESSGTRIILKPSLDATNVDYSIGVDTSTLWSAVASSASSFKWYAGDVVVTELDGGGNLSVLGTTDTSSVSTGSVIVAGGAGFAKSVSIGGTMFVQSASVTSTGTDVYLTASDDAVHLQNTSGDTSGEFVSTLTNFNFQTTTVTPYTAFNVNKTTGDVSVLTTVDSTTNHTGSFQVYGGASVSKSLWIGGDLTVAGSMSGSNPVTFANTTDSTSVTTGGVVMDGGLGVAKNVYIGGLTVVLNTTASVSTTTGALTIAGGVGIGGDTFFGGIGNFTDTTDSSSPATGAVVVSGGVGIGSSLFVGSTNDSTSSATGAVVVTGGLGVGGASFFGGNVSLSGTNPLLTFADSGLNAPTFTTESAGTKIILRGALSATLVDYSLGVDTNVLWNAVPQNADMYSFKWYGGTTTLAQLSGSGDLSVFGTTDTVSSASGSLIVAGGAGFAKSVSVGDTVFIQSTSVSSTGTDLYINASSDAVHIRNTAGTDSGEFVSSLTNFGFKTTDVTPYVTLDVNKTTGHVSVLNTDDATGNNTGALQVHGGASVSGSLWVGSGLTSASTTQSVSTTTGGLVVSGGVGITKNVYVGGLISSPNTTASTSVSTGALTVAGGIGIGANSFFGGIVKITNTTDTTSSTTGSLITAGGLGIGKSLFVGSTVTVSGGTTSSSSTTGAVVISGGLGVGGDSFFGGKVTLSGTNPLLTFANSGLGAPTFTTESSGTKIVLRGAVDATDVDYSLGVNTNTLWTSVPQNNGTYSFDWYGGTTVAMRLDGGGNLSVYGTGDSSSVSTGSLTVAGGAGFAKSVSIGGTLFVRSASVTSTGTDVYLTASDDAIHLQNTSGDASGEFVSTLTDFNFQTTTVTPYTAFNVTKTTGDVSVFTTVDATANHTGSFQVYGGESISKSLWVGGNTTISGDLTVTGSMSGTNPVTFANTTDSTSVTTGGVVMDGGLGVAKNVYVGGHVVVVNTTNAVSPTTGALTIAGGVGIGGDTFFGGVGNFTDVTDSDSPATGSIIVSGGVGIGLSLFVGSTNDSTSSATGAVVVTGGLGVGGSSFFGGNVSLSGTNPLVAFASSGLSPPTFTTESSGTRLILNPTLSPVKTDYSIGVDTNVLWTSVPQNNSAYYFKWYGGTTVVCQLDGGGNLSVNGTTDTSSTSTGGLVVAGGAGFAKSVSIGTNLFVRSGSWTSTGTDIYLNASTDSVYIRNQSGAPSGEFESSLTDFNFKMADVSAPVTLNVNKTTGVISVFQTDDATANNTGALQVHGGASVSKSLWVGSDATVSGDLIVDGSITGENPVTFTNTTQSVSPSTGSVLIAGGLGVSKNIFVGGIVGVVNTTVASSPTTGALTVSGGIGVVANSFFSGVVNVTNSIDAGSSSTGALIVSGGIAAGKSLFVGSTTDSIGATSGAVVIGGGIGVGKSATIGGNVTLSGTAPSLIYPTNGSGPPTFVTSSTGTKVNLLPSVDASDADYAIGIDTNTLWSSVPKNTGTFAFKWYGGTTVAMKLDGAGNLAVYGTTESSSTSTGSLTVAGGVGITKSLFVGSQLSVANVSTFSGAVTLTSNLTMAGQLIVNNTTDSTSPTTGSIITSGGIGIADSAFIGDDISVGGTATISGDTSIGGTLVVTDTTDSTTTTTGAVVVAGGLGVNKSLNVGGMMTITGDATVNGNFFVNGSRTEIDSQVLTTTDNVILVNSAPSGTADAGFSVKRYEYANDATAGDVVTTDTPEKTGTVLSATGASVVLDSGASSVDGWYNGGWIVITGGTGSGQVRRINTYVGSTKTATIYTSADQAAANPVPSPVEGLDFTTEPDDTSTYAIFTGQYVMTMWDEIDNEWVFGTTPQSPLTDANVPIRNMITLFAGTLKLKSKLMVDEITNYTSGAGTTVEGVLLKSGAVSGVTTLNGGQVDVTSTVGLLDNDSMGTAILPGTVKYGSYMVLVTDVNSTGASATFLVSGNVTRGGSVFRTTGTLGANNENLTVEWSTNDYPRLMYAALPSGGTGATYTYRVKTVTV